MADFESGYPIEQILTDADFAMVDLEDGEVVCFSEWYRP